MDAPVLGSTSKLGSLVDENDGWICLFEKEDQKCKSSEAHNGGNIFAPAPPEIGSRDEATDEGREQRSREDGNTEHRDGDTSLSVVKHVGENGSNDGKRTSTHKSAKESADEDGLKVLSNSYSDRED